MTTVDNSSPNLFDTLNDTLIPVHTAFVVIRLLPSFVTAQTIYDRLIQFFLSPFLPNLSLSIFSTQCIRSHVTANQLLEELLQPLFPLLSPLSANGIRLNYIRGNHLEAKVMLPICPDLVSLTYVLEKARKLPGFQNDNDQSIMLLRDELKAAQRNTTQNANQSFGPGGTSLNGTYRARYNPCSSLHHPTYARSSIVPSHDLTKLSSPLNLLIVPVQRIGHQHGTLKRLRNFLCPIPSCGSSYHIFILHGQSRQPNYDKRPFHIHCPPSSHDCPHSTSHTVITSVRTYHSNHRRISSSVRD